MNSQFRFAVRSAFSKKVHSHLTIPTILSYRNLHITLRTSPLLDNYTRSGNLLYLTSAQQRSRVFTSPLALITTNNNEQNKNSSSSTNRCYSSQTSSENDLKLIYTGRHSNRVKYAKRLSLFTATLSIASIPLIMSLEAELSERLAMATSSALIGILTTFVLHNMSRIYVCRLYIDTRLLCFVVETVNFFGRPKRARFDVGDIQAPSAQNAPFITFTANGADYHMEGTAEEIENVFMSVREELLGEG